jgi:branched-chain amino acid aminotransferase
MTRVWLDGEVLEAADALIPALDHGVTTGDGVFETMKLVRGRAFALTRHLRRLRRSAATMGLEIAMTDDGFRAAVAELIAALDPEVADSGKLRITVTGGPGPLGSTRSAVAPTLVLAAAALEPWPATAGVTTSERPSAG